jgi:hypothetical protein
MEQYLRTVTNKDQHDWARWIPLAQYIRNSWVNSTTKKTPYKLILGYTPRIHQPKQITALPGLMNRMEQLQKHHQEVQDAMKTAQQCLVKESNYKPFQVNDRVWLEGTNLNLPYLTKKLAPRQFRPFRVVTKISDVAYKLELPQSHLSGRSTTHSTHLSSHHTKKQRNMARTSWNCHLTLLKANRSGKLNKS